MTAIAVRVRRTLLAGMTGYFALGLSGAGAQTTIDIGLMGPFSGPWAEHGKFMRIGAEMAVEEINRQGGIKSLGAAKINLVVADTGPSVETATNAAQRLLSQGKLTAFTCCFLSSFSLAASEIGERMQVPMLTFSYSDVLVRRGYKYTFRDSSGADFQVKAAADLLKKEAAKIGKTIRTAALAGDNTAASVAYFKSLAEVLPQSDIRIALNRVWTPPLADAIPVALAIRDANPDVVFLGATTFDDTVGIIRAFNATGVKKLALIGRSQEAARRAGVHSHHRPSADGIHRGRYPIRCRRPEPEGTDLHRAVAKRAPGSRCSWRICRRSLEVAVVTNAVLP